MELCTIHVVIIFLIDTRAEDAIEREFSLSVFGFASLLAKGCGRLSIVDIVSLFVINLTLGSRWLTWPFL